MLIGVLYLATVWTENNKDKDDEGNMTKKDKQMKQRDFKIEAKIKTMEWKRHILLCHV